MKKTRLAAILCIILFSSTDSKADIAQSSNSMAAAIKLPLIDFSYENGKLTKEEEQKLGFYRVYDSTTLKMKFACDPKLLGKAKWLNLTFKVSRKKLSNSKSIIRLLSGGVELTSRKGAAKGKWVSMKIPTSKFNGKSPSLEIILKGGNDKLHVACREGIPLVEMHIGLPDGKNMDKPVVNDTRKKKSSTAPKEVLNVSAVGRDKTQLVRAFTIIQKYELEKKYGQPQSFKIIQKLGEGRYLVNSAERKWVGGAVSSSQSIGGGGGVGGGYSTWDVDTSKTYLLVAKQTNAVDGEYLKNLQIKSTKKSYSYTTVLGARKTVNTIEEITSVAITKEDFVERLKAGESWILPAFRIDKCGPCFGDGKMGSLKNYAKCKECKGKGSFKLDCVIRW